MSRPRKEKAKRHAAPSATREVVLKLTRPNGKTLWFEASDGKRLIASDEAFAAMIDFLSTGKQPKPKRREGRPTLQRPDKHLSLHYFLQRLIISKRITGNAQSAHQNRSAGASKVVLEYVATMWGVSTERVRAARRKHGEEARAFVAALPDQSESHLNALMDQVKAFATEYYEELSPIDHPRA